MGNKFLYIFIVAIKMLLALAWFSGGLLLYLYSTIAPYSEQIVTLSSFFGFLLWFGLLFAGCRS